MTTSVQAKHTQPGEYVRKSADSKTTFVRGEYDRKTRRYSLQDCDDFNRETWVKPTAILFVGFTY